MQMYNCPFFITVVYSTNELHSETEVSVVRLQIPADLPLTV